MYYFIIKRKDKNKSLNQIRSLFMGKDKKRKGPDFADLGTVASATECTGILSSAPQTHEGLEEIMDTMKFSPTDAPMKKKDI